MLSAPPSQRWRRRPGPPANDRRQPIDTRGGAAKSMAWPAGGRWLGGSYGSLEVGRPRRRQAIIPPASWAASLNPSRCSSRTAGMLRWAVRQMATTGRSGSMPDCTRRRPSSLMGMCTAPQMRPLRHSMAVRTSSSWGGAGPDRRRCSSSGETSGTLPKGSHQSRLASAENGLDTFFRSALLRPGLRAVQRAV